MFGLLVGTVVLLSPPLTALAANRCEQVVLDDAKQLSSRDVKELEDSAKELKAKGADVHIITLNIPAGLSIDEALLKVVNSCPDWQASSEVPAYDPTLNLDADVIVLAAAPRQHATSLRFGSRWAPALANVWPSIEANDMNPLFRRRDLVGGFEAGERRIAQEIDRARVEAQTQTDSKPLSAPAEASSSRPTGPRSDVIDELAQTILTFAQWMLSLVLLTFLLQVISRVFGGFRGVSRSSSSTDEESISDLEQALAREQKSASERIAAARKRFAEYDALGGSKIAEAKSFIDQATERYAKAAGLDGVSADTSRQELRTRAKEFSSIAKLARNAEEVMEGTYSEIATRWKPEYTAATSKSGKRSSVPVQSAAVENNASTSSGDGFLTGMLVGSLLSPSDRDESSTLHSSLDLNRDFLGGDKGGSSSWGSSSSSDSGGSSSWDSSSGGSSDWGSSGSDGGSSSW